MINVSENSQNSNLLEKQQQASFDFDNYINERKIPKYKDLIKDKKLSSSFEVNYLSLLKSFEIDKNTNLKVGSIVDGKIISITKKEILIDINYKDNIIIDSKSTDINIITHLKIDDKISAVITEISNKPYYIKGSISDLIKMNIFEKIKDFFNNKIAVDAYIKELIPAGYITEVEIDGIKIDTFMPNTLADVNKIYNPDSLVGKTVKVVFESLQQERGIYVVNRKKYLRTLIADKIKIVKKQQKNKVYTGFVTGTTPFGIFVQFEGCLTGMIHKYNINEAFRDKISEIKPGTEIDFYVKEIIKNDTQIILSQFIKDSLWDTIKVDDIYTGKVIAIILNRNPNGVLIELDHETNGLIQNTFLIRNKKELKVEEKVDVRVISINKDDRKIYLTFADDQTFDIERQENLKKLKERYNN
jgi:small subunit ribosomal protein S1